MICATCPHRAVPRGMVLSRFGLADLIAAAGVNDYRSPLTTIERVGGG